MIRVIFYKTVLVIFLLSMAFISDAQKSKKDKGLKKYSNVGFAFNLVDFDPSIPKKDSIYGFSAMYWKGLSRKFDLTFRYNGIFSNKINNTFFSDNKNRMSSEFELSLSVKALRDQKVINPFLTAGVGVGNYKEGVWQRYEIGGVGLQINFKSELYMLIQANYRYSLDIAKLPHNSFYSIGLTRSLHAKKKPTSGKDENDRDKDGVPDSEDDCPDVAGKVMLKGCPDKDDDGVPDKDDKCPDQKGVAKYKGCPIPDADNDGVNDEEDKCPTVAGVARYNGCPVPDTDKDGINDEEDKCPNLVGTIQNQGCPSVPEQVRKQINKIAQKILFVTASADLQAKSFKGLNDVVKILTQNPEMKLTINGHTDSVGTVENNQSLSERRALTVKAYFISRGISENRITANGYGESRPVADNGTQAGRQQNRRVELILSYYKTDE